MRIKSSKAIAAAMVATIVISISTLTACEGRKMSNMTPTGDTVEVEVSTQAAADTAAVTANSESDTEL